MLLATKACTKALLGSLIVTGTPGLALGILTSIAQHSTDRGLHDEAMGIFSVVLVPEPMHRRLDGITAIAHLEYGSG